METLHIVADANIPCVNAAFGKMGTIDRFQGRDIGPEQVEGADVLLVRSVTPVGPSLLDESPVRFVGSATIGTDHVNRQYLKEQGIAFAHAPGSNADSVADYAVGALLLLARRREERLEGQTVGVVGCGNVGSRVARRLEALGLSVLRNDPPLARAAEADDRSHEYVSLDTVLGKSEIVTTHVPLTTDGPDPTHHLIDEAALDRLRSGAWLLNTARGPVVDNAALLRAIENGAVGAAVLDVWENEPAPDPALVEAADVATPHIAGYAYDGKVRGTTMLYTALCEHLDVEPEWDPASVLEPEDPDRLRCQPPDARLPRTDWLHHLAQQAYDLRADDERMRGILERPPSDQGPYFSHLRATYPTRREMQKHTVPRAAVPEDRRALVTEGLTMQWG